MTCSEKKVEEYDEYDNAHFICLLYKFQWSSRGSDDLSIGFHRSTEDREIELTKKKPTKRNCHFRFFLQVVLAFAEHQEKATYGL